MSNNKNTLLYIWYIILAVVLIFIGISVPKAQDIVINNFGGGLNTNTSVINLKPNEGSFFLNLDLVGTPPNFYMKQRDGTYKVYPTGDTTLGNAAHSSIFSFRRADGRRRIVGVASQAGDTVGASIDSTGLGWFMASSAVPINNTPGPFYVYREGVPWRYYKYVYTGITPHWTYWNDRCYITNGRQRPLVFHPYDEFGKDGYVRELVPLTPGEPLIVPMNTTGKLNGKYFYMIGMTSSCGEVFGANEAVNSDFESWTGNLPDSWDSLPGSTGFISETTDSVKNGSSALKVISREFNPFNGSFTPGVRQTVRANRDSTYELTAWVLRVTENGSNFLNHFFCIIRS